MYIPEEKRESLEAIKALNSERPSWRHGLTENARRQKYAAFGEKIIDLLWGGVSCFLEAQKNKDGFAVSAMCRSWSVENLAEYLSVQPSNIWPFIWYTVAVRSFGDDRILELPMHHVITCIRERHPSPWEVRVRELLDSRPEKTASEQPAVPPKRRVLKQADRHFQISTSDIQRLIQLQKERCTISNDTPRAWKLLSEMGRIFIKALDGSMEASLQRRDNGFKYPMRLVPDLAAFIGSPITSSLIYHSTLVAMIAHVCREELKSVGDRYRITDAKAAVSALPTNQWKTAIQKVPLSVPQVRDVPESTSLKFDVGNVHPAVVVPAVTPVIGSPTYQITVTVKEKNLALYLMSFCMDDARYHVQMDRLDPAIQPSCPTDPTPVRQVPKKGWQNEFVTILAMKEDTWNRLKDAGIHYLGELVAYHPMTLKGIAEMEDAQVMEIENLLKQQNLYLGMPDEEIPDIKQSTGRVPRLSVQG